MANSRLSPRVGAKVRGAAARSHLFHVGIAVALAGCSSGATGTTPSPARDGSAADSAAATGGGGGGGGVAPGLLGPSDLKYAGSFRLPQGKSGIDPQGFSYSGAFMSGNVYNDPKRGNAPTLFVTGSLASGRVDTTASLAQVSIPALADINAVGRNGLSTATLLQPFADPTAGHNPLTGPGGGAGFCGYTLASNNLLGFCGVAYDANGSLPTTAFVDGSLDLSHPSSSGPYTLGTISQDLFGGYAAPVPAEWQAALGAKVVAGNGPWSIISVNSCGPGLHTVDVDALLARPAAGATLPSTPLVYYPDGRQQIGSWQDNSATQPPINGVAVPAITVDDPFGRTGIPVGAGGPRWPGTYGGGVTSVRGVFFADGTRSVLFFGKKGLGPFCYGQGTSDPTLNGTPVEGTDGQVIYCYDPDDDSKGGHGYPYTAFVWAYDINDFIAAKQGTKAPWLVFPYTGWALKFDAFGGVSWDASTRTLYVAEPYGDPGDDGFFQGPLIHAFSVGTAP